MTELLPWERPDAPAHVKARQPVMEIKAASGIRHDLPRRRPPDELPRACQHANFGIAIMTHRGSSNGRLSVLLSSIPENYPIVVSSDSVAEEDITGDREVAAHHGADFRHCTPWGGRSRNARHTMEVSSWDLTLFLCDDVWLFGECVRDALRWFVAIENQGVPLACLGVPGWETVGVWEDPNWKRFGFESWAECLERPWKFESVPPNPAFRMTPALFKNPFGACMVINRKAYDDLGGFSKTYWAHDDVFNHDIWLSNRWVCAAYPGRGYMHLGAQSWHHGESQEYVREFKDGAGMTADESGKLQVESILRWREKIGDRFLLLGGTESV